MKIFTWKIGATPRHGEGPPKRRQLRLGELEDSGGGLFGPPRRGVAHLGKPLRIGGGKLRLGGGKLRLGVPVTV